MLPARDEEELLGPALEALDAALGEPGVRSLPRALAVVLDECRDGSARLVRRYAAGARRCGREVALLVVERERANVGAARAAGCEAVLAELTRSAGVEPADIWLATTDADSQVPLRWLAVQVAHHDRGTDVWAGRVTVADWSGRPPALPPAWLRRYESEAEPAHGASLGCNAAWYLAAGGFQPLPAHEDRGLLDALRAAGAAVRHDPSVPVVTSARRAARAPAGFARALDLVEDDGLPVR